MLGLQSDSTSHTVCHSHLITHNSTAIWPHLHSCRIWLSILYESLIRLRSHTVRIFTGVTTAFCNQTHTRKFSGLTTAFSEHALCEWNRAGQLIVGHVIKSERASLLHKCTSTVWCMFSCVFLVTYGDGELSWKVLDSVSFPPEPLPSILRSAHNSNAIHTNLKAAVS